MLDEGSQLITESRGVFLIKVYFVLRAVYPEPQRHVSGPAANVVFQRDNGSSCHLDPPLTAMTYRTRLDQVSCPEKLTYMPGQLMPEGQVMSAPVPRQRGSRAREPDTVRAPGRAPTRW